MSVRAIMVVTDDFEVTRGPTLGNSYGLRPARTPLRTLGFSPLVASAPPPRLLVDIAIAGLHVRQINHFLNHHVSDDELRLNSLNNQQSPSPLFWASTLPMLPNMCQTLGMTTCACS